MKVLRKRPCDARKSLSVLQNAESDELYLRVGVLDDLELEVVELHDLVELGESLYAVEDQSAHGEVVVALRQLDVEELIGLLHFEARRDLVLSGG